MSNLPVSIPLPSKGIFNPTLPDGVLELNPIRVKEEKYLVGITDPVSVDKAYNAVLRSCIVSPISPEDLVLPDRVFVLFHLRMMSYGPKYHIEYTCPYCAKRYNGTVDLEALNTIEIPDGFVEPFEVTLPMSGKKVGLKCLRQSDVEAIARYAKNVKTDGSDWPGDSTYAYSIARHIVTVDGVEMGDRDKIEWVENLLGGDAAAIHTEVEDKLNFGIDTTVDMTCPKGHDIRFTLPFTSEFFRPRSGV